MEFKRHILITGGAGFIGSHLVRRLVSRYPNYRIVNLDALTYAGNLGNLSDIEEMKNYVFVREDIRNLQGLKQVFGKFNISDVIHCAAESHVDRSILNPAEFVETNVTGTVNLLRCAGEAWSGNDHRFYHISTDEVYGELGETGLFTEETAYDPRSPYSASKASSDHFVRAWHHTYDLPIVISNCSNNYGPYQFPEKLIPLMIRNARDMKPLPVYGEGTNVRDWLYVEDHAAAIDLIFHKGRVGQTYNIGGGNEWKNIDVVKALCRLVDQRLVRQQGTSEALITFVKDRAGHDFRYAIDYSRLKDELGWEPSVTFEEGLSLTVDWYLGNRDWLEAVTSGEYRKYYEEQYALR